MLFFFIIRRPPGATRTDTLFPYTTRVRVADRRFSAREMGPDSRAQPVVGVPHHPPCRARDAKEGVGTDHRHRLGALARRLAIQIRLCRGEARSEEHTSELQSLMRTSYAVFCLQNKK